MPDPSNAQGPPEPVLRRPTPEDGAAIWALVRDCRPLDENSMYCNLIQCDHFADTCVVAELAGEVVGWISGHIKPGAGDTLFIWQVAVSPRARGYGLGTRMLAEIMDREVCDDVTRMETTITRDNDASWALFRRFAKSRGGRLTDAPYFTAEDHFANSAKTEHLVTIALPEDLAAAA